MTSKLSNNRSGFVRQQGSTRKPGTSKGSKASATNYRTYNSRTMYLPTETRLRRNPQPARNSRQTKGNSRDQQYDLSFSLGRTSVQAPAITFSGFDLSNPRLVSGILALALAALLIFLWTASTFSVSSAEVTGNSRIDAAEIGSRSGILGDPIFKAVPSQVEETLRIAFPELKEVKVKMGFPNHVIVKVVERIPLITWYQQDTVYWIDSDGIAFIPRGEAPLLVQVTSTGSPIDVIVNPDLPYYEQKFINPEVVQAITNLAPSVPDGMLLIYDPEYGIGWQDPRGWTVQIGQNTQDLSMKLTVYQALVDRLVSQGIQPSLISMEFLDAPFYK
jgi:cell division protein FtsQ